MTTKSVHVVPANLKQLAKQQKKTKKLSAGRKVDLTLQTAQIPRNEQSQLVNLVDRERKKKIQDYLAALIAPQMCLSRIPDSFARPTALVRSTAIINIPVYTVGSVGDQGRFAFAVSPSIGSLSDISKAKIALVDASGGWPAGTAGTVPQYVKVIGGDDIRIDPFYVNLTQGEMGLTSFQAQGASAVACTAAIPFGTNPSINAGYNLPVAYGTAGASNFYPPPGQYSFNFSMYNSGVGDMTPSINGINGATISFFVSQQTVNNSQSSSSGYLYVPAIVNGLQPGISISVGAVTNASQNSQFTLTRTFTDSATIPSSPDHGLASQLRPVAMSCLTTYSGPTLVNGGMISSALLTGGSSHTYFFDSNNPNGNVRNWENLAILKDAYNGRLQDGSYVWWAPESVDDYEMKLPSASTSSEYPTIVVAGQFTPGTASTAPTIARVLVTTIYEILTESLFLESEYQAGSQETMDRTMNLLMGQPHAMANATHQDWIADFVKGLGMAAKFVKKNKNPLMKVGAGLIDLL
jgi:hypothetical protein